MGKELKPCPLPATASISTFTFFPHLASCRKAQPLVGRCRSQGQLRSPKSGLCCPGPSGSPGGSSTVGQEPSPTLRGCLSLFSSEALQFFSCSQLSSFHPSHFDFFSPLKALSVLFCLPEIAHASAGVFPGCHVGRKPALSRDFTPPGGGCASHRRAATAGRNLLLCTSPQAQKDSHGKSSPLLERCDNSWTGSLLKNLSQGRTPL